MSFRNRLTVFFIVLVILPMVVVAAVGFVLAADSEQGKTDARLSEAQGSASGLFREFQDRAEAAARTIARDEQLAAAIQRGERGPIQRRFDTLAQETELARGVMRLDGVGRFETGRGEAVAPARTRLLDTGGGDAGAADRLGDQRAGLRGARRARDRLRRRHQRRQRDDRLDAPRRGSGAPARARRGRDRRARACA